MLHIVGSSKSLNISIEKKKIQISICDIIVKNEKKIQSFFTFYMPDSLRTPKNLLLFPSLIHRIIKKFDFGLYIYCFELGSQNKGLHAHLACTNSFCQNYLKIKKFWVFLIERTFKVSLNKSNIVASSDHKSVVDTWYKIINYCCKQLFEVEQIFQIHKLLQNENVRLYGGSSEFSKVFHLYRDFLESFLSNKTSDNSKTLSLSSGTMCANSNIFTPEDINSKYSNKLNMPQIQSIFEKAKDLYLQDHPNVSVALLRREFINEIHYYTDVMFLYDMDDFMKFVLLANSTAGHFYSTFYSFLKKKLSDDSVLNSFRNCVNVFLEKQKHSSNVTVSNCLKTFFNWNNTLKTSMLQDAEIINFLINVIYILHKYASDSTSGSKKLLLFHKLANLVVNKLSIYYSVVVENIPEHMTRFGHIIYSFFVFSVVRVVPDFCIVTEDVDNNLSISKVEESLDLDVNSILYANNVLFSFTSNTLSQLKSSFSSAKDFKLANLTTKLPMLIPPKIWKLSNSPLFTNNNIDYFSCNNNFTGGLLLNNIVIFRPLCKINNIDSQHSLHISKPVLDYVNKLQMQSLFLDKDLLKFFIKHKHMLPSFLSYECKLKITTRLTVLRLEISKLFKQKKLLTVNIIPVTGTVVDQNQVNLTSLLDEKKELTSRLDSHNILIRLLESAQNLINEDSLYYTYEFDFRMRLYCNPFEVSYMGSKIFRSLLRFSKKREFAFSSFLLYSVLQYSSVRNLSETEIEAFYYSKIENLFINFSNNFLSQLNSVREPFMFLSCYVEWKRYHSWCQTQTTSYMSNFPIYLDCSANGPQLIVLFFALEKFASFLNLSSQSKNDVRGDFYSVVINNFLIEQSSQKWEFIKTVSAEDLLNFSMSVMRPILKTHIMTRFYGSTYISFLNSLRSDFVKNLQALQFVFNVNDSNIRTFCVSFAFLFWKYLQNIPLFQLDSLLRRFQQLSNTNKRPLEWSVFNVNHIRMFYKKIKKSRYPTKINNDCIKFVLYKSSPFETSTKQRSAFMANFVHSLDAYVLYRTCAELPFEILPIHDSFGIHSVNVNQIRLKIKEIFTFLVAEKGAAKFFICQLSDIIEKSSTKETKNQFLLYVQKELNFGTLTADDVSKSYYYIFYS